MLSGRSLLYHFHLHMYTNIPLSFLCVLLVASFFLHGERDRRRSAYTHHDREHHREYLRVISAPKFAFLPAILIKGATSFDYYSSFDSAAEMEDGFMKWTYARLEGNKPFFRRFRGIQAIGVWGAS
jgi:hypothetical protein